MTDGTTGRWRIGGVVVAVAMLAACTQSDQTIERSADETTTTATTSVAPATTSTTGPTTTIPVPELAWTPCGAAECATLTVPLDHDEPFGPTIELFASRLPATGDRLGSLLFNFGGPGASAADLITIFPVPDAVRARFDLVGLDPRGVGRSSPLACGIDPVRLYGADPTVEDADDRAALVEVSQEYAADCASTRGDVLPHVGSRAVARDLDVLRAAMRDEQLNYIGYSYGTSIGQAYAELFPHRVRTMILDGVVDPAPAGVEVATQQAMGFETALSRWAAGCGDRGSCRLADPVAAVEEVLAAAESNVPSGNGRRALGPGEAAIGLAYPLYDESLWSSLDEAVVEVLGDGDGAAMVDLADRYLELVEFPIYFAVSCLDMTWPSTADDFFAAAKRAGEIAPRFGEAIVNDYLRCAVWPTGADPLGAISAPGAPAILVVSTTGDPATPYQNGVTVADRLGSGVLLTHEGDGHTITFQGSTCVDRIAVTYLVDARPPADGVRC